MTLSDLDTNPLIKKGSTQDIELTSITDRHSAAIDTPAPKRRSRINGWKFSLTVSAVTSFLVLAANLSVTIWSATKEEYEDKNGGKSGLRILLEGDCAETKKTNTAIHLVINALSTVLLAASNYCMQCLSAPTRRDIQKAHSKGRWLDIGVPSVHNLFKIPSVRRTLWVFLVLSSVPLHLLYNSVVFASLSTLEYDVYTVEEWPSSADSPFNITIDELKQNKKFRDINSQEGNFTVPNSLPELWKRARQGSKDGVLDRLTPRECIDVYATAFQTTRQHLIIVTESESNSSLHGIPYLRKTSSFKPERFQGCPVDVYEWICPIQYYCESPCRSRLSSVRQNSTWAPFGAPTKYCLSEPVEQHCKLYFSTYIIIFVIVANAVKVCVILYTAFRPPQELLLVLGDAIESFLKVPDVFSTDSCFVSSDTIKRNVMNWTGSRPWSASRRRLAAAVSHRRWIASFAMYFAAMAASIGFLIWGVEILPGSHTTAAIWALGIGSANEVALISFSDAAETSSTMITRSVILSNLPQICFSFLYFQYNGLFTAMLAAKEWSEYGQKRRGLRVAADPRGAQRSRYFLQLPYRWGTPILLISILIHWLLSQSLFVVAIESERNKEALFITCGYSPAAIILVIIASLVMFCGVIITGILRLPTAIPLVGSCSLAIAAACHHPNGIPQPEAPFRPLKWGVMQKPSQDSGDPGHCGFSSEDVGDPEPGAIYS